MSISTILATKGSLVSTISATTTVIDIVRMLREKRIGAVLVTDRDGNVIGVVSERDIVRGLADQGADVLASPALQIMTSPVVTCAPHDTVQAAMTLMTSRRIRHLPVMADGKLCGLVSIGDLVKHRIEAAEMEAESLKEYITSA